MQAYSNPKRESDPYSLPDVEIFRIEAEEFQSSDEDSVFYDMYLERVDSLRMTQNSTKDDIENWAAQELAGFYYWACFPGCLPDSDPIGPFETYEAALEDAQSEA